MKKNIFILLALGTAAVMLSSCRKNDQADPQSNQSGVSQGPKYNYNIELSANVGGRQGGGIWLWMGLEPSGDVDYAGADCGHGGVGATNDRGEGTWHYAGANNDSIVINGVILVGLGNFPTTIEVPSAYGHYTGTLGSYLTLPGFIPANIGTSQLQVAH